MNGILNFDGIVDNIRRDDGIIASSQETNELTKEEHLKRVENFAKEHNLANDDEYIYLYKATDMEGKDDNTSFIYSVGKIFGSELDTDINKDYNTKGIKLYLYNDALKLYKGIYNISRQLIVLNDFNRNTTKPINPSILNEKAFRLFLAKVRKSDIIITKNNYIRAREIEVIEEIELEPKINYSIQSISEDTEGFRFSFKLENSMTGNYIYVSFTSKYTNISQDEIKEKIKERVTTMQEIYDKFMESNGEIVL